MFTSFLFRTHFLSIFLFDLWHSLNSFCSNAIQFMASNRPNVKWCTHLSNGFHFVDIKQNKNITKSFVHRWIQFTWEFNSLPLSLFHCHIITYFRSMPMSIKCWMKKKAEAQLMCLSLKSKICNQKRKKNH